MENANDFSAMREMWNHFLVADLVAAFLLTVGAICGWCKSRGESREDDHSRALRLGSKPVIVGFLTTLVLLLVAGFFLYSFAYPSGYFVCMALPKVYEFGTFALPSLAGIAAGAGFIYKKTQAQIDASLDLKFYILSALILTVGYVFYVASHARPVVIVGLSIAASFASIVGLFVSIFARATWAEERPIPESAEDQKHPQTSSDEVASAQPAPLLPNRPLTKNESRERIAKRQRLIGGTKLGLTDGLLLLLFGVLLAVQLGILAIEVGGPMIHLRVIQGDAEEQRKCASND